MENDNVAPQYWVWGVDRIAYGPVELPALVSWVKDERVTRDTWVFLESQNSWIPASAVPELRLFLARGESAAAAPPAAVPGAAGSAAGIKPGVLRRIRAFAEMEEAHLESFLRYTEVIRARQFSAVVRKGERGAAMYLVLEGELRARVLIDGRETTLSTMTVGDFFGEVSLWDHGPRSADVIANQDSLLLRVSSEAVEKIVKEAPALAAPFLYGLGKTILARLRALTRKYEDSIHWARVAKPEDRGRE